MKKLRLMGILLFSLGGSGINLADASVLSQCKIAWQDDWVVNYNYNIQPVQLLGWSRASGDTNGLFFYRSHEIMYFEFGNAVEGGVHLLIKDKIYFVDTVAPASISGIALDGDKLLVAFQDEDGVGSWIKAFDWTKIKKELDAVDNHQIILDQDNEKEYLKKNYPHVRQTADGIGRIYVTPSNHYLYGQYDIAGRKIGTWDQAGNFLGWVDGSNDIYRNQFLAVQANSDDQSHFYAYQQYDDKHTIMMKCSFAEGCSNYGGVDFATSTKASEYIPFTNASGWQPYPSVLFSGGHSSPGNDIRSLWEGNKKVLEFSLPTPPFVKNITHPRVAEIAQGGNRYSGRILEYNDVAGIAQESHNLNPWSVYILKDLYAYDGAYYHASVLYQCPYNNE